MIIDLKKLNKVKPIHFIGVGGCGMNPIAKTLFQLGYTISGSDFKPSTLSSYLIENGAQITIGHHESTINSDIQLVVFSTAISPLNCERIEAKRLNIPTVERAIMLNSIMQLYTEKISIAGTHGKTTTSSMLACILDACQKDPTYIIGSEVLNFGKSSTLGTSPYFVAESDESDGSFLYLHPNVAIISNIENEHMEFFKTSANLFQHFVKFSSEVIQSNGHLFINADDALSTKLISTLNTTPHSGKIITYGLTTLADFQAKNISPHKNGISFSVDYKGTPIGAIDLRVFGIHNVYNALSTIAYAMSHGLPFDGIQKGLLNFYGTKRRFQLIGEKKSISVFDDYGHHPTEIKTTLEAIKNSFDRRIVCIFQPHRYTRTRDMFAAFSTAFDPADHVIITDIFSAHEKEIKGINSQTLVQKISNETDQVVSYIGDKNLIVDEIMPLLKPKDIVITMGAGDIHTVANDLYHQLSLN
ncbi:UDP-N-acetylmuramate--L-alanine ligase [bacterium]|nr:UDP-N-acetylmuramate--L-alanine ligase [bacterium]